MMSSATVKYACPEVEMSHDDFGFDVLTEEKTILLKADISRIISRSLIEVGKRYGSVWFGPLVMVMCFSAAL